MAAATATGRRRTGTVAIGLVDTGLDKATAPRAWTPAAPSHQARPGFATPAKVRAALAKRHAVVLLFFNARSSDDRAVRRELAAVNRRRGRVQVYGVSVRGISRFKNVLQGVGCSRTRRSSCSPRRTPYVFPGYTDRTEINQAAAVALRTKKRR